MKKSFLALAGILLFMSASAAPAADTDYWAQNFTTSKKYQHHYRESFNKGWRFKQGNPSGTPQNSTYDDATWEKVNLPHSVSYEAPDKSTFYIGIAWYRKEFTIPAGAADKKVFIEFEGAMSTAQIWVNGIEAGSHVTSGYTGFMVDISGKAITGGTNIIAVKVDNSFREDVPPGNGWIDYITYGGLYRDAWLHITDRVYVPQWGQIISTPTVTTSSATVRVNTTVVNEKTEQASCTVAYEVFNSSGDRVSTQTAQQTLAAKGTFTFSMNSTIASPALWSPSTPNLYKITTTVSVDGQVVDDVVERFGVRTMVMSKDSGFILNGKRFGINGCNLHQGFGWVHAAVPTSRQYKLIETIKDIGFNSMRCSHYPRDPSFYDACDEMGLLIFVETPSWGWSHSSYSSTFWNRATGAFKELVLQANNHPCVLGYGYFNEPVADFGTHFSVMKQVADSINPLLLKYAALNPNGIVLKGNKDYVDFVGYQYVSPPPTDIPGICTEYLGDAANLRGDATAEQNAADYAWAEYQKYMKDTPRSGGVVLWCLKDYWCWRYGTTYANDHLGLLDECFVPKRGYYLFRKNLTGKADDNPVSGTATKVSLEPDLTYLRADGTDLSRIIIALRDGNGKCINSNATVTLSLSGSSCTLFGPTTVNMIAGKLGIVLKSTETVGATTITATSNGLAAGSVTLTSYPAVDYGTTALSPAEVVKPAARKEVTRSRFLLVSDKGISHITVPKGKHAQIFDMSGRLVASLSHSATLEKLRNVSPTVYVVIMGAETIGEKTTGSGHDVTTK